MNDLEHRIVLILLFVVTFVAIGWLAPVMYVNAMPASHFVDVHNFTASDTYTGAESHEVCFNRTVKRPDNAVITIELLMVDDDGSIVEKDSFKRDAYLQEGQREVAIQRDLQWRYLEAGTYRYVNVISVAYYDGRAVKDITFESDEFTVHENESQLNQAKDEHFC